MESMYKIHVQKYMDSKTNERKEGVRRCTFETLLGIKLIEQRDELNNIELLLLGRDRHFYDENKKMMKKSINQVFKDFQFSPKEIEKMLKGLGYSSAKHFPMDLPEFLIMGPVYESFEMVRIFVNMKLEKDNASLTPRDLYRILDNTACLHKEDPFTYINSAFKTVEELEIEKEQIALEKEETLAKNKIYLLQT